MRRYPLLGRGDLMRLLEQTNSDVDVSKAPLVVARAEAFGYKTRAREALEAAKHGTAMKGDFHADVIDGRTPDIIQAEPTNDYPTPVDIPFWAPIEMIERTFAPGPTLPEADALGKQEELPKRPRPHPLTDWAILGPRLRAVLAPPSEGRTLDIPRAVAQVARGAQIHNLPREKRRAWPRRLLVIFDRSAHMAPFVADQEDLIQRTEHGVTGPLSALSPGANSDLFKLFDEDLSLDLAEILGACDPPQNGACLVLGDLGVMAVQHGVAARRAARVRRWLEIGRALRGMGCRPIALVPYPVALAPSDLRRVWRLTEWDPHAVGGELNLDKRGDYVERLLALTAPAKRIEPGLLRAMRRAMTPDADAGVEAAFWAHPAIAVSHLDAAAFDPERQQYYVEKFAELAKEERARALGIIGSWRVGLKAVRAQEILGLPAELQGCVPPKDLADAHAYMAALAAEGVVEGLCQLPGSYQAWILRAGKASPALHSNEHFAHLAFSIDGYCAPEGVEVDPQHIPPRGDAGAVSLAQTGRDFQLSAAGSSTGGTPLLILPSANGALMVKPDEVDEFWDERAPPNWALDWNVDENGPWVSFKIGAVEQQLRWCRPGAFLMGSPKDEPGRYGDEGPQHKVHFAEGYWLFDTPVTQGLYEAVTGENPRGFRSPEWPVESVSWDQAQAFIKALNRALPGLALRLPSEAEWEYACRAGTTTAYAFGDSISKEQANFNAKETVPVKSYAPNAWGLYEMHGNVYEWCEDHWHDSYVGAPADGHAWIDVDASIAASRVIRGGSWYDSARYVRSAYRLRSEPQDRLDFLGFRCARGPERARPAELAQKAERNPAARRSRVAVGGAILLRVGRGETSQDAKPMPKAQRLRALTDRAEAVLAQMRKPAWASAVGRDRFGLYAEFEFGGDEQKYSPRLRWIPPGWFDMGSPEVEPGRWNAEGPIHRVHLREGYWLFDTPVTQGLFEAVTSKNPSRFQSANRPVENVSWDQAQAFIETLNRKLPGLALRLPSEAEWEYACRAGTQEATYAGAIEILGERNAPVLNDIAWYGGNSGVGFDLAEGEDSSGWEEKQFNHSRAGTRPVKLKTPNAWGLYDMLGNVWEWCEDHWHDSYDGAPGDGSAWLDASSAAYRVLRGGSWHDYARLVRSAFRLRYGPQRRYGFLGFRCARGPSEFK